MSVEELRKELNKPFGEVVLYVNNDEDWDYSEYSNQEVELLIKHLGIMNLEIEDYEWTKDSFFPYTLCLYTKYTCSAEEFDKAYQYLVSTNWK